MGGVLCKLQISEEPQIGRRCREIFQRKSQIESITVFLYVVGITLHASFEMRWHITSFCGYFTYVEML